MTPQRGFVHNLFGTIANMNGTVPVPSHIDFIPNGNAGETIQIKGDSAEWLGLKSRQMQKYAYDYCHPVASVVDRLAEYDLTGELLILKIKGKGKEDIAKSSWAERMRKLLEQPNPMQNWHQFRGQQNVYKRVFGFCPVLPLIPAAFEHDPSFATCMINLPPWLFEAKGRRKFILTSDINEIIEEYIVTIYGNRVSFKPQQIFILEDGFVMDEVSDFLLPQSRLVGLDFAISNLCASMEADNVLLKKKGPLGFISHDAAATKDAVAGYIPMEDEEKEELQAELTKYGLSWSQFQYAISRQAVKWNPMSFDVKQLGTKETVVACEKAICHRYGYNYVLYEDTDATYANGENAASSVFQNNIIPNNKRDMNKYNKFFKARENDCEMFCDFSDLSALQEDKLNQGQAAQALDNALLLEYENDIITKNQWLTARGYDTVEGGDVYFSQSTKYIADQEAKKLQAEQQQKQKDDEAAASKD